MLCKKCKQIIPNCSKFCLYCGKNQLEEPTKKKHYRPHGHGSISYYKNCPKNPYRARVRIGDDFISLGYFPTSKAADKAITDYMAAYEESQSPRSEWTLQRFYDTWSEKAFAEMSKNGVNAHKASWKYMQDLAPKKMRELKTADYQSCIDKAKKSGKSRAVCEKIRNLASLLCQEAMRDDVIDKNYARLLELPKSDKKEKDIFTDKEISILLSHDSDIEARIILMLIYTGLRIGEFLALRPCDIDTENWILVGGSKTEAGKNRVVPILSNVRAYFLDIIKAAPSEKSPIVNVSVKYFRDNYFYEYLAKLGILTQKEIEVGGKPRLTPHCTRHTYASKARKAGMDKDAIIRIMGHTDYTTTDENYVSMDSETLASEAAKIAKMDNNNVTKK